MAGLNSALAHRLAGELVITQNQNTVAEIALENQQRGCNLQSCPGMYAWWMGWLVCSASAHRLAGEFVTTQNQNTLAEIVLANQQSREAVTYVLVLVCIYGGCLRSALAPEPVEKAV